MTIVERNVGIVKQFVHDLIAGNGEALFARFSPELEMVLPGSEIIPWAGTFRGLEAVGQLFGGIAESLEIRALEPVCIVASEDRVVIVIDERSAAKATNKEFRQRTAWLIELDGDGKFRRWELFEDTEAIAATMVPG